jgi:hypothetical protein
MARSELTPAMDDDRIMAVLIALYRSMRPDSQLAFCQFLASHEAEAGGSVLLRGAWRNGRRLGPEAAFTTERWPRGWEPRGGGEDPPRPARR